MDPTVHPAHHLDQAADAYGPHSAGGVYAPLQRQPRLGPEPPPRGTPRDLHPEYLSKHHKRMAKALREGPVVLMTTQTWDASKASMPEKPTKPARTHRRQWKRQAAIPRQSRGRDTAREAVDHYGGPTEGATYGAAAGYGPNQSSPRAPRNTPRGARPAAPRRTRPPAEEQEPSPYDEQPPPLPPQAGHSQFAADVHDGLADLEDLQRQVAALEQPVDDGSVLPPISAGSPRSARHASGVPLTSPKSLAEAGSGARGILHSTDRERAHAGTPPRGSPRSQRSGSSSTESTPRSGGRSTRRRRKSRWRPEEELRLAEGVGFFGQTGVEDWAAVAAHVNTDGRGNIRQYSAVRGGGQPRPRGAEECRDKWAVIQHGAVVHELKLATKMADKHRLVTTLATASAVGLEGEVVTKAQAVLEQILGADRELLRMREASATARRQAVDEMGEEGEAAEEEERLERAVQRLPQVREKIREAVPLSVPAAARLLRSHNRDRSGWLAFTEFRAALRESAENQRPPKRLAVEDNDLRRAFRAVGKSDDGRVELTRLAKSIWSPPLEVPELQGEDGDEAMAMALQLAMQWAAWAVDLLDRTQ